MKVHGPWVWLWSMGRVWLVSAWRGSSPRGSPGGTWPGCCRRKLHHQKKHLAPVLRIRIRRIHICNFPVSGFKKLDPDSHKEEQLDPIHKKCMRIHSPDFLPALTKKKKKCVYVNSYWIIWLKLKRIIIKSQKQCYRWSKILVVQDSSGKVTLRTLAI